VKGAILDIFSGPYALLAKWAVIGLLIAGVFVTGWVKGNQHGTAKLTDYIAKQATEAVRIGKARTVVTEKVITKYVTVTVPKTQVVTNTIEKEVIRYETAKLDTCPLSNAAVSLHDAAAANAVPEAARSVDGAASGIETSALTKTCTENYAIYHQTADRLRALQEWVKEQGAVK
jgi:hypothetical protein